MPAPLLVSDPAMVRATAGAAFAERRSSFFAIDFGGQRPPLQTRLRRCRSLRPGSLPWLLCRVILPRESPAVCKRRNARRHRSACNSRAQFPGRDRSRCTGHRHNTFPLRFPDIYLQRRPSSIPKSEGERRKKHPRCNDFCSFQRVARSRRSGQERRVCGEVNLAMKSKTAWANLQAFGLELILYGLLVTGYFFLVLRYLSGWLQELHLHHVKLYALVAILLIVGQAVLLESVTTWLLRFLRGRSE